jgi:hypothetical protein
MMASYVLSRTLAPTLAMYLLKAKQHGGEESLARPMSMYLSRSRRNTTRWDGWDIPGIRRW